MRILLHACCGPCSLEPARVLREAGHEIAIYYANSNIAPAGEYARRLQTLKDWAAEEGIAVIEGAYDPATWEETVGRLGDAARKQFGLIADEHAAAFAQLHGKPEQPANDSNCTNSPAAKGNDRADSKSDDKADAAFALLCATTDPAQTPAVGNLSPEARTARRERCRACYRLRFGESARYAADHSFDALGTTLSVSPYQYTDVIEDELRRACAAENLACAFADYRPLYDEATRRSRELGMYRQNFCGCRFSAEEAAAERKARKEARRATRTAEAAEHSKERAREEAARAALKQEKAAYAEKQARKHAILKALRESR